MVFYDGGLQIHYSGNFGHVVLDRAREDLINDLPDCSSPSELDIPSGPGL